MCDSCKASTAFRGAGNNVHRVSKKPVMVASVFGEMPLKDFLDSVSSDSPVDVPAYYSMIGILKNQQKG